MSDDLNDKLDGTFCMTCGIFSEDEKVPGHPRYCWDCKEDAPNESQIVDDRLPLP